MTLTEKLGDYFAGLSYDDLPPAVVDKAKAVLLHGLMLILASVDDEDVRVARAVVDAGPGEARVLGRGDRLSRMSAAFIGTVLIHARSQDDSYRMLTHPGAVILPAVFAEAEGRGLTGKQLLTAIVAGYEVQCRIARDVIPAVQNHGFRSSALFGIFGPAAGAAKVLGLNPAAFGHALNFAVGFASGNAETSRLGTREMTFQEGIACHAGMQAARIAGAGVTGARSSLEGAAGFYYSYTGSASGELSGGFDGETQADLSAVAADLGSRWEILNVTMKIYSSAGYTQPVIEALGDLAKRFNLRPEQVERIDIEMNPWETVYPSPRFPKAKSGPTDQHSTAFLAAQAIADQGYAVAGRKLGYGEGDAAPEAAEVQALASRVHIVAGDRRQYAPKMSVRLTDGSFYEIEMTGNEFKWDFATERERVRGLYPALPCAPEQAETLVRFVEVLENADDIDGLISEVCRLGSRTG